MGKTEVLRIRVDASVSGQWEQVKGDLHSRVGKLTGNGAYLGLLVRIYLELQRQDRSSLSRAIDRVRIEDQGRAPR